jgi:FkbM family methyltransferase
MRSLKFARSLYKHWQLFGVRGAFNRGLIGAFGIRKDFLATIPDSKRRVYARLGTTDVACFEQVLIAKEYDLEFPDKPRVIVDVGANVGMTSVYFAIRFPFAKIFAIEPALPNFRILEKNCRLFPQITPIHAAIWDDAGVVYLNNPRGDWSTRVSDDPRGAAVSALTMPALMAEFQLDHIDILKVDAEGAECEIFANARDWIDAVEFVCIELHDRFRDGCSAIFCAATVGFSVGWRSGELRCVSRTIPSPAFPCGNASDQPKARHQRFQPSSCC